LWEWGKQKDTGAKGGRPDKRSIIRKGETGRERHCQTRESKKPAGFLCGKKEKGKARETITQMRLGLKLPLDANKGEWGGVPSFLWYDDNPGKQSGGREGKRGLAAGPYLSSTW